MVDRKASQVYVVDDVAVDGDAVTWDASLRQWAPRPGLSGPVTVSPNYYASWTDGLQDSPRNIDAVTWSVENQGGSLFDDGSFLRADDGLSIEVHRDGLYRVKVQFTFDSTATATSVRPGITSASAGVVCDGPSWLNAAVSVGAGTGNVDSALPAPYQPYDSDVVWLKDGDLIVGSQYGEITTLGYTAPKIALSGSIDVIALV